MITVDSTEATQHSLATHPASTAGGCMTALTTSTAAAKLHERSAARSNSDAAHFVQYDLPWLSSASYASN